MRFNDKDLIYLLHKQLKSGESLEGQLQHKAPPGTFRETGFRARYFRLVKNFLFYFKINELNQIEFKEPAGVIVLENYSVRAEKNSSYSFAFSILFLDEPHPHIFTARSDHDVEKWVLALNKASYQFLLTKTKNLNSSITALKEARKAIALDRDKLLKSTASPTSSRASSGCRTQPGSPAIQVKSSSSQVPIARPRPSGSGGTTNLLDLSYLDVGSSGDAVSPRSVRKNPFLSSPIPPPRSNTSSLKALQHSITHQNQFCASLFTDNNDNDTEEDLIKL